MMNSDFLERRVAIYARVSTEHEAQLSALENQMDWYGPILEARPEWHVVDRYIDEGITGTSAQKRPEFMRMIREAKQHKFDLILTREVSRFARNTVDTLQYTRMLRENGVEVFFINDNIRTFDGDGELRLTIMATLAQDESRKTSIRVKSGQQTSMNNGVVYGNGNILGYTKVGDKMVIDPEQARTVRLIYDMYLDGKGLMPIKYELERRGYLTSMGKTMWYPTVISKVLRNPFYCGVMVYHKQYTPDYLKQKKINNYGEIEFTKVRGTHEPIVTKEEYERVQRIREEKSRAIPGPNPHKRGGKRPHTTVWGKLMRCSCGAHFTTKHWSTYKGKPVRAYQCCRSVQTGSYESRKKKGLSLDGICQTPMVVEWQLQMMAYLIFQEHLQRKEEVLAMAKKMLEDHIGDQEEKEDTASLLESKRASLDRLSQRMNAYVDMCAEGDLSREMFRAKSNELQPRIELLREEIRTLERKNTAKPKESGDYQAKLKQLMEILEDYTDPWPNEIIPDSVVEAFVDKIVASPEGFSWYLKLGKKTAVRSVLALVEKDEKVAKFTPWESLLFLPSVTAIQAAIKDSQK